MMMKYILSLILFFSLAQGGNNYLSHAAEVDNVIIGGQPNQQDFLTVKQSGIETIVNLRTLEEMRRIPFAQKELIKQHGFNYHHLEIGGASNDYSPEKLQSFSEVMRQIGNGKTLVHCRSGNRVNQLMVAYLIKFRGLSPDAVRQKIAIEKWHITSIEKLLGQPLTAFERKSN